MSEPIQVVAGQHKIEVHCPHVENGACIDCLAPQIVPYIAARQTLDDLLPKFTLLSDAMRALAKDAERMAKGTDKLREWTEAMAKTEWKIGPPPAGSETEGETTRPASKEGER